MSSKEQGVSSVCPHCRAKVVGASQFVGRQVACPKCGQRFLFGETTAGPNRPEPAVCQACGGPVDWDARRPKPESVAASPTYWILRLLRHESHVLKSDPDGKTLRSLAAKEAGRSDAGPMCKHCLALIELDLKEMGPDAAASQSAAAGSTSLPEDRALTAAAEAWQILQTRAPEGFTPIGAQSPDEATTPAAESESSEKKPKVVAEAFDFLAAEEADKQEHATKRRAPKDLLRCFRCDQQTGCDSSHARGLACPSCHSRLTIVARPDEAACLRLADVALRLAERSGERQDWETVVRVLRGAMPLRSDHPIVLSRLGESLMAWFRQKDTRGDLASALSALEPAIAFDVLGGVKSLPAEVKSAFDLLGEAEARLKEAGELFEGYHRAEQLIGELEELRGKRLPELMTLMRAAATAAIRAAPAATCGFCKKPIEKPVCLQLKQEAMPVWVCKECERPYRKEAAHGARPPSAADAAARKPAPKTPPPKPTAE